MDFLAYIMSLKAQGMAAAQITAAVNEYLQDHPDALDQAAVEAILDGRLDVIDNELSSAKSAISAIEGEIGSVTKITNFSSASLSTWAGLSNGLCINNAAIQNLSGKIVIEFYDNSSDPTYSYWFVLYAENTEGTLTVVDKKEVSGHSTDGVYTVDTGWTTDKTKKYYVGLWNANANRFKYVPFTTAEYPVMYKTGIYTSASDITVNSTVAISNLSTANDRSIFCNVTVVSSLSGEVDSLSDAIESVETRVDEIEQSLSAEVETVVELSAQNAFVWAGMSGRVMLNEVPIIHQSGTVVVDYYAPPSAADFSLLLYELTAPGVIKLINKYDFTSAPVAGLTRLTPAWTVRDDKIYYVALYTEASGKFWMAPFAYYTYYGSVAASSLTVGSTLNIRDIEATNTDRTLLLNVYVTKNGLHYPIPHIKRIAHFSVDDCVFWADLIANEETYTSCFENATLNFWKRQHDLYGVTVTLNCFCSDGTSNISSVPNKWAAEFAANIDWLRFAFHAQAAEVYYNEDKVAEITASYEEFVDAIIKMTGTSDAIDGVTRLGYYTGTLNNCIAIRDAACGISGLLTADDTRKSYYLTDDTNPYILNHNWMYDAENHLTLIHTLKRLEFVSDYSTELTTIFSKSGRNQNTFLEFFTHEANLTNFAKVGQYAVWCIKMGVEFGFAEDHLILH